MKKHKNLYLVLSPQEKILGVVNPLVCKVVGHTWVHKMRDWLCDRCRVSHPYSPGDDEWGYYGSPPRYWKPREY